MKILVVDDERMTRRLLNHSLARAGYQVIEAEDGLQALEILRRQSIRLIITDWVMPNMNGLEFIRALRRDSSERLVYIILLTSKDRRSELVAAMNAGADDFISKPFDQDELRVRVRAGQRILELTERLERQAMTDPLTELLNRRGLIQAIVDEGFGRGGLGCIVADIDRFKQVNDTYGHGAGDRVLKQLAGLLRRFFEPEGIVSRFGGEEFWILVRDTEADALAARLEATRAAIEAVAFELGDREWIRLTVSFGWTYAPHPTRDALDALFKVADAALYRSKSAGRNRVTFGEASDA